MLFRIPIPSSGISLFFGKDAFLGKHTFWSLPLVPVTLFLSGFIVLGSAMATPDSAPCPSPLPSPWEVLLKPKFVVDPDGTVRPLVTPTPSPSPSPSPSSSPTPNPIASSGAASTPVDCPSL